jgi:hypothetical protein
MRRTIKYLSILFTLLFFVLNCLAVSAQTVVIPHTDRGWYNEATGYHVPSNQNYLVGDNRGIGCGECFNDFRNFFVFDLAGVTQPIASAKLALSVPGPLPIPGYVSTDPTENYELHDVTTPIATLLDGTGGVAAHTDLGSGVVYGSRTMTAADMGSVVEITLNATAISALDAALGGLFAFGGSITTLDDLPNFEQTFAFSSTGETQLRLTLVPEPSSLLLCLAGIFASLMCRRRPRGEGVG